MTKPSDTKTFAISKVQTPNDLSATIALFETYAKSLGIDLAFQDFATEMASMPGKYAPPTGCLFLARDSIGEAVGCVGLRPLSPPDVCEMKRLYVDSKGRGLGLGRALARAAIEEAQRLAYKAMRLDTLVSMTSARVLYERLGFVEIDAYYDTPVSGTTFLELSL